MRLALLLAAGFVVGCASVQPTADNQPVHRVGQTVEVGREASASVGSVVYGQFNYRAVTRAVLQEPIERQVGLYTLRGNAGQPLIRTIVSGGREGWCSPNPLLFQFGDARSACFFDPASSGMQVGRTGRFNAVYIVGTLAGMEFSVDTPYRVEEIALAGGFRFELIYQGVDRGVVRIAYREFNDSMARPAFQQDLSYTLETGGRPTPVSFRTVRLEILAADNNTIRYRVLSGFQ